jgi:hypothetical protein
MTDVTALSTVNAQLPQSYERAKEALSTCSSIDECKDWSDKAMALASYARQADDKTLENYAIRIRSRAIRRAGELLKQFDGRPNNAKKQSNDNDTLLYKLQQEQIDNVLQLLGDGKITRDDANGRIAKIDPYWHERSQQNAATYAGMSKRQKDTSIRVANVDEDEFNRLVESNQPPTLTALAEKGKGYLEREKPMGFKEATQLLGTVKRFSEFCDKTDPVIVANALDDKEKEKVRSMVSKIDKWLDGLIINI